MSFSFSFVCLICFSYMVHALHSNFYTRSLSSLLSSSSSSCSSLSLSLPLLLSLSRCYLCREDDNVRKSMVKGGFFSSFSSLLHSLHLHRSPSSELIYRCSLQNLKLFFKFMSFQKEMVEVGNITLFCFFLLFPLLFFSSFILLV